MIKEIFLDSRGLAMPLQDLKCCSCGATHEALIRKPEELKEEKCRVCGSDQLEVLLSHPANYTISGDNSASVRPNKSKSNL